LHFVNISATDPGGFVGFERICPPHRKVCSTS